MKRLLAGLALMLLPLEAQAGVLSCSFTEPFFSISFDSATGVVTWVSADETDPDTGKPIPKVLAKAAKLEILDHAASGQKLRLTNGRRDAARPADHHAGRRRHERKHLSDGRQIREQYRRLLHRQVSAVRSVRDAAKGSA